MWDKTQKEIAFELQQLQELLEHYRPLLAKVAGAEPEPVEVAALGAMLQSFYNGIENIFKRIALELDHEAPRGEAWHSNLLEKMTRAGPARPAVITASLEERLWEYLEFRHVFRSAYSFLLRWDKMAPLVLDCEATLGMLHAEVLAFLSESKD